MPSKLTLAFARSLFARVLVAGVLLATAAEARAAEAAPSLAAPVPAEHPRRVFSLTFSPIHLTLPVLELTGEVRLADKLGVAAIVGIGKYSETINGVKLSASVLELGAQARYYVLGDFRHGMQLGAELLYVHLDDSQLDAKGEGFGIGPFAGYKYTADIGFTFDAQLGAQHVSGRGSSGGSTTSSGSEWITLLNLNVGWSF